MLLEENAGTLMLSVNSFLIEFNDFNLSLTSHGTQRAKLLTKKMAGLHFF